MVETNGRMDRSKIREASLESGFEPPTQGSKDEQQTIVALSQLERYILMLDAIELPEGDNLAALGINHPIQILNGSCNDPRLRRDEADRSPLTPEEVAKSLSCFIDENTGMPKIPRLPNLDPWETVSHL